MISCTMVHEAYVQYILELNLLTKYEIEKGTFK